MEEDNLFLNYIQNTTSTHRTINTMVNILLQQERNVNNLINSSRERNREMRRNTISNNRNTISRNRDILQRSFNTFSTQSNNRNSIRQNRINQGINYTVYNNISNPMNNYCPISHEDFTADDNVIQIRGCGHIFNESNLLQWLNHNSTCPVCRYDILNTNERNTTYPRNTIYPRNTTYSTNTTLQNEVLNIISQNIRNELNNLSLDPSNTNLNNNVSNDTSNNIFHDLSTNEISFVLPMVEYTTFLNSG